MVQRTIRVALAGNPNVGKTSLFNRLTGSNQHVGNWPGVTVEVMEGARTHNGIRIEIVDLPGTYSLSAYSNDERIARDHILKKDPDIVVQVVDATNLERNLFLTLQLLELGAPLMIALNKWDLLLKRGDRIDVRYLSDILKVPIIPTVGLKEECITGLLDSMVVSFKKKRKIPEAIDYGPRTDAKIREISRILEGAGEVLGPFPKRWLAIKLIEGDIDVLELAGRSRLKEELMKVLKDVDSEAMELEMTDIRYDLASRLARKVTRYARRKASLADMLDRVITHRYLGIPIFLVIIWAMFQLTFTVGEPFSLIIDRGFARLGTFMMDNVSPHWLASLLGEGVLGGVGSVLVFLPNIMILFFLISVLEGSGYMSRAAYVMDRLMVKIGLSGKSFIPMVIGFGCNVPAIMATRTIEDRKDRLITILVNPFISCGARLPIYILFTGIFFKGSGGTVVFGLYLLGVLAAIGSAKLFRLTIMKGRPAPLIMELPDYQLPSLKEGLRHTWEKGSMYIRKAGTVILLGSVIMWSLANYSLRLAPVDYGSRSSIAGQLGVLFEPLISPLGFDWKIGVALIFGFFAKEIVVGALGVLYNTGESEQALTDSISQDPVFTPLTSMGLMVFSLLYVPCIATVGVIKQETGSWIWTVFSILYGTGLAWIAAFIIYQGGGLLGL
ncbi:MAG: ferrous iron transport protein B [Candidatus Thermoplasmatota archaeon]|nr:ferrous iron transport protein B [Candidatus Thermoplasmatota archaeon]